MLTALAGPEGLDPGTREFALAQSAMREAVARQQQQQWVAADEKFHEAERLFNQVASAQPDNYVAQLKLGELAERRGDLFSALGYASRAAQIDPQFLPFKAKLFQRLGQFGAAARIYDQLLEEMGWAGRKYDKSIMDPVMVRYPIRIAEKGRALAGAAKAGIELGSWFECPLHPIETPLAVYDYQKGMCPEAEKASNEVVNLPLHPRAGRRTVARTVDFITQFTQAD